MIYFIFIYVFIFNDFYLIKLLLLLIFFFLHFEIDYIQRYQEMSFKIFNFAAYTSPLFFSTVLPKGNSPVTSVCCPCVQRGRYLFTYTKKIK